MRISCCWGGWEEDGRGVGAGGMGWQGGGDRRGLFFGGLGWGVSFILRGKVGENESGVCGAELIAVIQTEIHIRHDSQDRADACGKGGAFGDVGGREEGEGEGRGWWGCGCEGCGGEGGKEDKGGCEWWGERLIGGRVETGGESDEGAVYEGKGRRGQNRSW